MTCKCGGSGLVPFVKDGRIIPNVWIDCPHCYQQPVEHYQPLTPADFDFPCSDTFRGFSYQYCNQPDPGYIPPTPEAPAPKPIHHYHVDISKRLLQNIEGQVKYLQGKVIEREKKKEDFY